MGGFGIEAEDARLHVRVPGPVVAVEVMTPVNILKMTVAECGEEGHEELAAGRGQTPVPGDCPVAGIVSDETRMDAGERHQDQRHEPGDGGWTLQQDPIPDDIGNERVDHVAEPAPGRAVEAAGPVEFALQHTVEPLACLPGSGGRARRRLFVIAVHRRLPALLDADWIVCIGGARPGNPNRQTEDGGDEEAADGFPVKEIRTHG